MPELPEVETIAADLRQRIIGEKIQEVVVHDARLIRDFPRSVFADCPAPGFIRAVKNREIQKIERQGKALIFYLSGGKYILAHLGMTGQWVLADSAPRAKVSITLSSGQRLHYNDQRIFGGMTVVADLAKVPYLRGLGPEPLSPGFLRVFQAIAMTGIKAPVKSFLLDQHKIAGIGNIYASEILFRAGIDPRCPVNQITEPQLRILGKQIVAVLKEAVCQRGTSKRDYLDASGRQGSFQNYLRVYGRAGKPCSVCGKPIQRVVQAGRSTFFCSICQK
ncbi:MAG: bifunctional DNA-formamidopyrimidine glycosylase/DNA-(apurinic or apyrimidinic site) lyase [Candidatus Omnitrophica bacterium]|nr:bifunctional DNA-formamidopyrimidine glycosylase/DNA-(apurinic or apyrimidinic site) lyase [Candidatus Omnitrophota bacterium]